MLAEMIGKLIELGRHAYDVQVTEIDGVHDKAWLRHNGELSVVMKPPLHRVHSLRGFNDIVTLLADNVVAPEPEVFVSEDMVKVWLNRQTRRDVATCALIRSEKFTTLNAMAAAPWVFDVPTLIRRLRFELEAPEAVISTLRRIDFTRSTAANVDIKHGGERLGKAIEAQVQQADKVPEEFTVSSPVWSTAGFSTTMAHIRCAIHIDVHQQRLELHVLPDQLRPAVDLAISNAVDALAAEAPDGVLVVGGET